MGLLDHVAQSEVRGRKQGFTLTLYGQPSMFILCLMKVVVSKVLMTEPDYAFDRSLKVFRVCVYEDLKLHHTNLQTFTFSYKSTQIACIHKRVDIYLY